MAVSLLVFTETEQTGPRALSGPGTIVAGGLGGVPMTWGADLGTIPPGSGACTHPHPVPAQHRSRAVGNTVLQGLRSRLLSKVHVEATAQGWGFAST